MLRQAIVRRPGEDFVKGLTGANLGRPDWRLALVQHDAYVEALAKLGLKVLILPAESGYPDALFVEDTAVVTEHGAVVTRPGAKERRGEEDSIARVLEARMPVMRITDPVATLDGGDVLRIEGKFIIGLSERTNDAGARHLAFYLEGWGYQVEILPVQPYLHLKTGVNYIGQGHLLVTRPLFAATPFAEYHKILVADDEEYAANSIAVNGTVVMPAGFPKLKAQLHALKHPVLELDLSEFQKLDGGMTCLSLLH